MTAEYSCSFRGKVSLIVDLCDFQTFSLLGFPQNSYSLAPLAWCVRLLNKMMSWCHRLKHEGKMAALVDFQTAFAKHISLIEWPQKLGPWLCPFCSCRESGDLTSIATWWSVVRASSPLLDVFFEEQNIVHKRRLENNNRLFSLS